MTRSILLAATAIAFATPALAHGPVLRTAGPIIHLADNLDEPDRLGWCIDTQGRGRSDALHVHSCKPDPTAEKDVAFSYDTESGQIRSATYENRCAEVNAAGSERALGLVDCEDGSAAQAFDYDPVHLSLHPRGDEATCLVAGAGSASAGPYVSRSLDLASCAETDASLRQWIVLAE